MTAVLRVRTEPVGCGTMSRVIYLGRSYGDDTDWLSLLREAAKHPLGPSWLRPDLDVASGLADLAERLRGTAAERALAEAALSIVETGDGAERAAVWQLPWERASRAVERLLALVQTDRRRLDELRGVPNVIWRLLQVHPGDAQVLAALRVEARNASPDPWIVQMMATYAQ